MLVIPDSRRSASSDYRLAFRLCFRSAKINEPAGDQLEKEEVSQVWICRSTAIADGMYGDHASPELTDISL